MVHLNCSNRR
uniref:Uncharacterized protein n=1 Tax=Anguilla anguilla TaxID=7936 RepID=A0A0E9UQ63_ANGAN